MTRQPLLCSKVSAGVLALAGTFTPAAAQRSAVVAGGVLYAIDQDPGSAAPFFYRNTAPAALAVGSVGIAAMSVGLWWWSAHGRGSSPMPAFGSSGGFIGWAGDL